MFWCVLNLPALRRTVVSLWCYVACLCLACIDVVFSITHPNRNLAWCIAFRSWITSIVWIYNLIYIYIISSVYAHATGLYLVIKWRARICQDDNFPTQWQTNEQQGGGWALITYGFPKTHTVPDANTYLPFCHICSRHSAESALHIKDQGLGFFFEFTGRCQLEFPYKDLQKFPVVNG